MIFFHVILIGAVVLLANADPAPGSRESKLTLAANNAPTKRLLTTYTTDEGVDDERGITVNIPGLDKLSKAFTSSKTKELQGLLKADDNLGTAFKALRLSKIPIGNPKTGFIETEKVVKLFSSRNFKVWSQHAAKMNKQDPAGEMLTALTNVFGEKNLATMILLGKHSWGSSSVAKKLEKAQFNKWYAVDKHQTADDVLEKLLLGPFAVASTELGGQTYPTAPLVLPALSRIRKHLERTDLFDANVAEAGDEDYVHEIEIMMNECWKAMLALHTKRFRSLEESKLKWVSFLDPRVAKRMSHLSPTDTTPSMVRDLVFIAENWQTGHQ
ncbi:hypothetical protein PC128_g2042 [Phytophthora cactorum]|nr:hypothetical protein PC128_g2042 [Phytophthora cactorum]